MMRPMLSARQSAVRLLQLMMIASVVLPAVLFAWASWLGYRHEYAIADERIERSLDILHEHTLKVFQTVERSIAEVDEIVYPVRATVPSVESVFGSRSARGSPLGLSST